MESQSTSSEQKFDVSLRLSEAQCYVFLCFMYGQLASGQFDGDDDVLDTINALKRNLGESLLAEFRSVCAQVTLHQAQIKRLGESNKGQLFLEQMEKDIWQTIKNA